MSTASVPNSDFITGTTISSSQLDANFAALITFLNNYVAHLDGSKTMTGQLTLPSSDPTNDDQAVRKAYVDKLGKGARVFHSANVVVANAAAHTVAFDSETFDNDTCHDPADNSKLTCKTAGTYLITANISFSAIASGERYLQIKKNAATTLASVVQPSASPGFGSDLAVTTVAPLAVNDYLQVIVYQSSGGNLGLNRWTDYSPVFSMVRIGA